MWNRDTRVNWSIGSGSGDTPIMSTWNNSNSDVFKIYLEIFIRLWPVSWQDCCQTHAFGCTLTFWKLKLIFKLFGRWIFVLSFRNNLKHISFFLSLKLRYFTLHFATHPKYFTPWRSRLIILYSHYITHYPDRIVQSEGRAGSGGNRKCVQLWNLRHPVEHHPSPGLQQFHDFCSWIYLIFNR